MPNTLASQVSVVMLLEVNQSSSDIVIMQQKFQDLRTAFASGPEAGAQAWEQIQELSSQGYQPAQLFVATQKLKSPAPFFDLDGALELLRSLVGAKATTAADRQSYATALHWLGEALLCHFPDQLAQGYEYVVEAARLGNVQAQLDAAYCLHKGVGVSVDKGAAVNWLREAAKQGHPRAFFELGMLLTGMNGNTDNDKEALKALQRAASFNYPAAGAMAGHLAQHGYVPERVYEREKIHSAPSIEHITAVLDPIECSHIAALSMPHLKPSRVISDERSGAASAGRSSEGMNFHPGLRDVVVTTVIRRLCDIAGCKFANTEALTALMYIPGAQYRVHPDYFPLDTEAGKQQLKNGGQRIKTIVCYLNEVAGGGETEFPDLGIRVKPVPGSVVYFENADEQGQPYPASRHAGLPVTAGMKWISTLWIRQSEHDQWM